LSKVGAIDTQGFAETEEGSHSGEESEDKLHDENGMEDLDEAEKKEYI
jgi:hypothetical protein